MERNLSKNMIFRWFECGLSVEETAKLCYVTVSDVTKWDAGEKIPPACKRLMRICTGRELPTIFTNYWDGWRMAGHHLISPSGSYITRQRLELIDTFGTDDLVELRRIASHRRKLLSKA